MKTITKDHKARIHQELKAAGLTNYSLIRTESRYLPQIIHDTEHIEAAIFGRVEGSGSAMLVATDKRVIYFNRMPLFTTLDEVTYNLVSGVSRGSHSGIFSTVTLHTRAGDYTIRFGNLVSVDKFIKFIEKKCIEVNHLNIHPDAQKWEGTKKVAEVFFDPTERSFLAEHELATLSTIDRNGNVDGAAVYYTTLDDDLIYIVTKGGTQKMHNIFSHPQVALTIYDEPNLQTLQLQGIAEVETDKEVKKQVFNKLVKERDYKGEKRLPPVTQIHEESFLIVRITPTAEKFRNYKKIPQ